MVHPLAKPHPTRRRFLKAFGFGLGSTLGALGYASWVEPCLSIVTRESIILPGLPRGLDGLKIAQLTDLHFRPGTDDTLVDDVVAAVNAEEPDLIALTGDYVIHNRKVLEPLFERLALLRARHGVYVAVGNHDGWFAGRQLVRVIAKKFGFEFLLNEGSAIQVGNESLYVAGTDHIWMGHPNLSAAMSGRPKEVPTIALIHEPDFFDHVADTYQGVLQLSGHTHGGQCRVPFADYSPVTPEFGKKYIYGAFERNGSSLFVSRGIGTTGIRVRFACVPEAAMLTLRSPERVYEA